MTNEEFPYQNLEFAKRLAEKRQEIATGELDDDFEEIYQRKRNQENYAG